MRRIHKKKGKSGEAVATGAFFGSTNGIFKTPGRKVSLSSGRNRRVWGGSVKGILR